MVSFKELKHIAPNQDAHEKWFVKQIMTNSCPRCYIDKKLKEAKSGILIDTLELKVYNDLKRRPHKCELAGPSLGSTLKLQVANGF